MPSLRTDAREALVVLRLLAHSPVLAGFGAAGGHQRFTVLTCRERHQQTRHVLPDTLARSCKLGGNSDQTDTDTSVSQSYRMIFFIFIYFLLSRSASQPAKQASQDLFAFKTRPDISLSVSTTHGSNRKLPSVSDHCSIICCSVGAGSRQTGNVSSAPFPPRRRQESLSLSKVLWIFPKRRLDKHETVCPSSLRRFVFCQIIKSDTREIFSSRLPYQECLPITKGALQVRGLGMLEPRGSLAVELCSTAHTTLRTSFQ